MHAKAIQETQLIGMEEFNKHTLEGLVNLEKVKEIRRAIRRRYANRKNFKKIFSAWDEDSQGMLSVKNVFNMVKKLGLNANVYEAQVLVASADRKGNGHLSLDEFLDLIFNDNTMLNVDLKKIQCIVLLNYFPINCFIIVREDEDYNQPRSDQVLKILTEDARDSRVKKHQNQVQLILQNQINPITNYCLDLDEKKEGFFNKEKYKKLLEKINIPNHILTNEDRDNLFSQFKDEHSNFDYKNFITQIRNFNYKPDEAYVRNFIISEKKMFIE
jgi:Ca2+-binding EF-hand superfamily protein